MALRHHGLTSNKAGLAVSGAHATEEAGVRSQFGLHGVHHAVASVTSDLTERIVLAQVHHCSRICNAAVVAVGERRNVPLAHVLHDLEEVGLDIELGGFASGVSQEGSSSCLRLLQGVEVTTLGAVSCAIGFSFEQLVCEDAIPPAAVS